MGAFTAICLEQNITSNALSTGHVAVRQVHPETGVNSAEWLTQSLTNLWIGVPVGRLVGQSVDWYVLLTGIRPNGRTQKIRSVRRLADRSADLSILPVGRNTQ
jgi:hypothetical protein